MIWFLSLIKERCEGVKLALPTPYTSAILRQSKIPYWTAQRFNEGGKHVRCFGNIIGFIYIWILVYRYALSLRIQVNQSLSRFFFVWAEVTLNRTAIQHEVFLCRYGRQSCSARPQNFTRTMQALFKKLTKRNADSRGVAPPPWCLERKLQTHA